MVQNLQDARWQTCQRVCLQWRAEEQGVCGEDHRRDSRELAEADVRRLGDRGPVHRQHQPHQHRQCGPGEGQHDHLRGEDKYLQTLNVSTTHTVNNALHCNQCQDQLPT